MMDVDCLYYKNLINGTRVLNWPSPNPATRTRSQMTWWFASTAPQPCIIISLRTCTFWRAWTSNPLPSNPCWQWGGGHSSWWWWGTHWNIQLLVPVIVTVHSNLVLEQRKLSTFMPQDCVSLKETVPVDLSVKIIGPARQTDRGTVALRQSDSQAADCI